MILHSCVNYHNLFYPNKGNFRLNSGMFGAKSFEIGLLEIRLSL